MHDEALASNPQEPARSHWQNTQALIRKLYDAAIAAKVEGRLTVVMEINRETTMTIAAALQHYMNSKAPLYNGLRAIDERIIAAAEIAERTGVIPGCMRSAQMTAPKIKKMLARLLTGNEILEQVCTELRSRPLVGVHSDPPLRDRERVPSTARLV